jgi:AcrR family transcriptional regulator
MQASTFIEAPSPALQTRSRRTVESLTRATLRLLRSAEFDALTISEIVAAANSSIGSFYARFPSKEDFLFHLAEYVLKQDIAPGAKKQMSPTRFAGVSIEPRMCAALNYVAQVFLRHRNIIRPLTLQMHTATDNRIKVAAGRFNEPLHSAFRALMIDCPELAPTPNVRQALDDVLLWSGASLRQMLLLRDPPSEREMNRTIARLAKCMANHLLSS